MDFVFVTLGAWAAFTVAAVLPGLLLSQVARGHHKAHA